MKRTHSILIGIFFIAFVLSIQTARAQEDVGRLLKQLENNSDRFSKTLNQALDGSRFNGTSTEDQINGYVKQFEDSTDRLKKNYDKGQNMRVSSTEVIERGGTINTFLRKNHMGPAVTTDWNTIKSDLNRLARATKVKKRW